MTGESARQVEERRPEIIKSRNPEIMQQNPNNRRPRRNRRVLNGSKGNASGQLRPRWRWSPLIAACSVAGSIRQKNARSFYRRICFRGGTW
ncbi:hypothetical protein T06_6901 [Trichinella sp. T6]|nr:hypothetical protein T06_6901 [Trichinella sp. T6]